MTIWDRTSRRAITRIQTYPSERKRGARQITMNQLRLTVFGLTLIFCGCDASSNLAADTNDSGVVGDTNTDSSTQSCDSGLSLQFERRGGQELSLYPSDRFTKASESSPTGLNRLTAKVSMAFKSSPTTRTRTGCWKTFAALPAASWSVSAIRL